MSESARLSHGSADGGRPPVQPGDMRRAMGRFATGVAVVSTQVDGRAYGMTVNSLTSVSLDPPLLLVCFSRDARTAGAVLSAGRFGVSILSADQEHLARRFAAPGEDHFAGLAIEYGVHAVPVIPEALVHAECVLDRHLRAGDHVVVFGRVTGLCDRGGRPLTFLGGRFGDVHERQPDSVAWLF